MNAQAVFSRNANGFYNCECGSEHVSVTSVLRVLNKPALLPWAAKKERELVIETAHMAHKMVGKGGATFLQQLNALLPQQKAASRALEEAGDVGSGIHALIEHRIAAKMGVTIPCPECPAHITPSVWAGAEKAANLAVEFMESLSVAPALIEQRVVSHTYDYAGTLDLFGTINYPGVGQMRVVCDWKSSADIYTEHPLQIAAYGEALKEMRQHPTDEPLGGLIVQVPKTGSGRAFGCFLSPLEMKTAFSVFMDCRNTWVGMRGMEALLKKKKSEGRAAA